MTNRIARTRIRSVRDKATGREMRVISPADLPDLNATLLQHARQISDSFPEGVSGFYVIAWSPRGGYNSGFRAPGMAPSLAAAFLKDAVTRDISTTREIDRHLCAHGIAPDYDDGA